MFTLYAHLSVWLCVCQFLHKLCMLPFCLSVFFLCNLIVKFCLFVWSSDLTCCMLVCLSFLHYLSFCLFVWLWIYTLCMFACLTIFFSVCIDTIYVSPFVWLSMITFCFLPSLSLFFVCIWIIFCVHMCVLFLLTYSIQHIHFILPNRSVYISLHILHKNNLSIFYCVQSSQFKNSCESSWTLGIYYLLNKLKIKQLEPYMGNGHGPA